MEENTLNTLELLLLDLRIRGIESQQLTKQTYAFRCDNLHTGALKINGILKIYSTFGIDIALNYIVGRFL